MKNKEYTTDGLQIIYKMFYEGHPERIASLKEEEANIDVAIKIYNLRHKAGLTQKQLADLIGTSPSVISRLEDADYQGHSLAMLRRIAEALGKRVEIRFVSIKPEGNKPKKASSRTRNKK
jgi:ribosome-binding protein aMBF1 (putative translation factor)